MIKKSIKRILYIYYYFFDKVLYQRKFNIVNEYDTVKKIIKDNCSISRYGDGEFKWIFGVRQNSFQDSSVNLSNDLKDSFFNNDKSCLIGIPMALNDVSKYNFEAKFYWLRFKCKYHKQLKKVLDYNKIYYDASFTRPYIDFKEKKNIANKFKKIKQLWNSRKILLVEGEGVNFGIGNDLLDNSVLIERIECPSRNAYSVIDIIYDKILKRYDNHLILIALGPTASILCNRLSKLGYQALDIGHLDVEYCWFINNCSTKVGISGKNVNEKNNEKNVFVKIDNDKLEREIIDIVKINGDEYE